MKTESTIKFDGITKRFKISYNEPLAHITRLVFNFDIKAIEELKKGNEIIIDLNYKIPSKDKFSKRIILKENDIVNGGWNTTSYFGEFLRNVTIYSSNMEDATLILEAEEVKAELTSNMDDKKILNHILSDNWQAFTEDIRRLSAYDLKLFISNHLNNIQEINFSSTELIEYVLGKQIIEHFGSGVIEIDQLDLAVEAYANGYDFIKQNNLLVIENYEKPDWQTLNTKLVERSEQVNREYSKLKEKIDKQLKDEVVWEKVLKRLNDFTVDAELIYNTYADVIDNLVNSNSIMNLDVIYQDWTLMQDNDARQQAKIIIQTTLPFGPAGFRFELLFLLEMNPATYQQEFTLTLSDCNKEILASEQLRHSKIIHLAKTREDLQEIHSKGSIGIEKEFYNILRDCISGSIIYRNFDFPSIK